MGLPGLAGAVSAGTLSPAIPAAVRGAAGRGCRGICAGRAESERLCLQEQRALSKERGEARGNLVGARWEKQAGTLPQPFRPQTRLF